VVSLIDRGEPQIRIVLQGGTEEKSDLEKVLKEALAD
jgi:hypothetical protein